MQGVAVQGVAVQEVALQGCRLTTVVMQVVGLLPKTHVARSMLICTIYYT